MEHLGGPLRGTTEKVVFCYTLRSSRVTANPEVTHGSLTDKRIARRQEKGLEPQILRIPSGKAILLQR